MKAVDLYGYTALLGGGFLELKKDLLSYCKESYKGSTPLFVLQNLTEFGPH